MKTDFFWLNPFKKASSDVKIETSFLSSVPIFYSLSSRQLEKVLNIVHVRRFEDGDIVFRQGDPGLGMYIVREGEVEIYNENDCDMTRQKIAVIKQGEFLGEISLLNDSPRSATVISQKKSTLIGLFRQDLFGLMESDPKLGLHIVYRLAQIVAERLRLITSPSNE
ncbi:MAG: cyclic nucleotide-binding domain-containing protein [Candidatus Latescibacteria bacterium]|jgi:CRP/FNR family transcriptional regulator, cyclic AMP receptor protein|nr:cyclic nucleotide-binding domain-containing protein [Candidatus Latescibacterota bacterium]